MTLRTPPASFNTTTFSAQHDKIEAQINKAATVLVTPRGTTPHLIGDAMPSKRSDIARSCLHCQSEFFPNKQDVRRGWGLYCSRVCSRRSKRVDPYIYFWTKVTPGNDNECWIWQGTMAATGYGALKAGGKCLRAHRVSLEIAINRPLLPGMKALHTCPGGDNKACVNPAHLREGTDQDNARDKSERGQGPRGEQVNTNKLTQTQVLEILDLQKQGHATRVIANRFGVSLDTVRDIAKAKSWKWLTKAA